MSDINFVVEGGKGDIRHHKNSSFTAIIVVALVVIVVVVIYLLWKDKDSSSKPLPYGAPIPITEKACQELNKKLGNNSCIWTNGRCVCGPHPTPVPGPSHQMDDEWVQVNEKESWTISKDGGVIKRVNITGIMFKLDVRGNVWKMVDRSWKKSSITESGPFPGEVIEMVKERISQFQDRMSGIQSPFSVVPPYQQIGLSYKDDTKSSDSEAYPLFGGKSFHV